MKESSTDYLSPQRKCLMLTAAFIFIVSVTCLALSGYQTNDRCHTSVFDSPSVDCADVDLPVCSDAPAIKFEYLTVTNNLAIYQHIKCSWRTRAAVLSIIAACAGIILSAIFFALALRGSSRGWIVPVIILYILTFMLMLTAIILEGIDLTKGRNFAGDFVRTAPGLLTSQPGIIYSTVSYERGSYIATIVLFCLALVGLTTLLIGYLADRSSIGRRERVPAGRQIAMPVTKTAAPPSLHPVGASMHAGGVPMQTVGAPMQKKVEVVDVRRVEQHLAAPAPHSQISAPYTTGGRQEGAIDISQEPAANRVNISY